MPFFSFSLGIESDRKIYKAPKGKQFRFTGCMFHNSINNNGVVKMVDRIIEDVNIDPSNYFYIANCNLTNERWHTTPFYTPVETKHVTIVKALIDGKCDIVLFYELIPFSKVDAIWTFIRRGKNP